MPVQNNRELFQERRLRLADGAAVLQTFFDRSVLVVPEKSRKHKSLATKPEAASYARIPSINELR